MSSKKNVRFFIYQSKWNNLKIIGTPDKVEKRKENIGCGKVY